MTTEQRCLAASEAANYSDPDAFVSDMILSSAFLPPEDEAAEPDLSQIPGLRLIWGAVHAPFREFLATLDMTQSECSRRFGIPLKTVQNWASSSPTARRECPVYVRLMMAELAGR